ncbi:DUF6178 family protein [Paraliomyxa miuraensis]|uniref:DUF6178 family protein n=1 Tax=Paraliomyxa miuraensis TaxID=376150 RepID=UPI002254629B|nr:DUF6178 family protein [Paraliomyxa miuraensis]MCX4243933.1 DUF6178 family protein [Paraliomyxa miuraensis]
MTTLSLRSAPTTHLLSRLIEAPHLDRLVRELPNERFTALVREIGVEDAGELVALATTEQLVAAFDEDLFVSRPGERETFDRRRFVTWLEVLLEAGDRAVAHRVAELSEDFVAHALSSLVLVFDHDQLRERITEDDPAAIEADGALERALNEEIDGYLLVARAEEGWDAVLALVLALDRSHRSLLVRVLDRCAALASSYVDDLDALAEVLSEAQTLAEDVEAAREERRSLLGYVEPRAAKGFLALARMPMTGELAGQSRDATTRAYFRGLERKGRSTAPTREHTDQPLEKLLAQLPSPASGGDLEDEAPRLTLALQALGGEAPPRFQERLAELAYLSNVVLAGLADEHGQRLRPSEAAQAALATVALGAELLARERHGLASSPSMRATPDELREVLEAHPADLLFRKACSTLVSRGAPSPSGIVRSRAELEQALDALALHPKQAPRCSSPAGAAPGSKTD